MCIRDRTFAIAIVLIFLVIWLLFCHSPFLPIDIFL